MVAAALTTAISVPTSARADNSDSLFLGNEAALTAGAVTASIGDGSAAWYNPGGLAKIERTSLDLAINAYGLRVRNIPGGHVIKHPDRTIPLTMSDLELYVVPTAVVYGRRFRPGLVGAVTVFVTDQREYDLQTELRDTEAPIANDGELWSSDQTMRVGVSVSQYMIGPSIGYAVNDKFRFGASLFFIYRSVTRNLQLWTHSSQLEQDQMGQINGDLVEQLNESNLDRRFGTQLTLGFQYNPTPRLDLGLTLRSPSFLFVQYAYRTRTESSSKTYPGVDPEVRTNFPEFDNGVNAKFDLLSNLRVHAGVAYNWDKASLQADFNLRPRNPKSFPNQQFVRSVLNIHVGSRFQVGKYVTMGTGLYTDFSAAGPGPFVEDVDFYGLTLGMRIERRLLRRIMMGPKEWKQLSAEEKRRRQGKNPKRRDPGEDAYTKKVSFATTIALRYGLGYGQAAVTNYEYGRAINSIPQEDRLSELLPVYSSTTSVFSHDMSIYLGSQIKF